MHSSVLALQWGLTFAFAAAPAAAAGAIPMWSATAVASEIVAILGLAGSQATVVWAVALSLVVSMVGLKFLMPWQAGAHLGRPVTVWVTWVLSILMSTLVVISAGLRIVPPDASVPVLLACAATWLCIEIVGTLGPHAAATRRIAATLAKQPATKAPAASSEARSQPSPASSAPSADELYDWLWSLFDLPEGNLPKGVGVDRNLRVVMTTQRRLASAWQQPRTNVVRLLKRLEQQGHIEIGTTERSTWIRVPPCSEPE